LRKKYNLSSPLIGIEATSNYHFHLQHFLAHHPQLEKLNPQIYTLNPKLIHNFKKAYNDLPKTDDIDAFVIADYLPFGRLPAQTKFEPLFLSLKISPAIDSISLNLWLKLKLAS
jgi:transposase